MRNFILNLIRPKFLKFDLTTYAKFQNLWSVYSDFIASFKWVIIMSHMHKSPQFSFYWTTYVIFTIYWKFRYRWRINMSHYGRQKRTQLIRWFWVIQCEWPITKFSVNRKYDVFCSIKGKLGWFMHVRHNYDSLKRCNEIGIYRW